jgi:proteasome lid subunit RPN8/RPN11
MESGRQVIEPQPVSPPLLVLHGHWLMVLERDLRSAWPNEGCALLLGEPGRVQWVWPCLNAWRPVDTKASTLSRRNRFSIDSAELVVAQRWCRDRQWQLLGAAHSHPTGPVMPSAEDLSWGWPGAVMLIRGYAPLAWGAWYLSGQQESLQPQVLTLQITGEGHLGK